MRKAFSLQAVSVDEIHSLLLDSPEGKAPSRGIKVNKRGKGRGCWGREDGAGTECQ